MFFVVLLLFVFSCLIYLFSLYAYFLIYFFYFFFFSLFIFPFFISFFLFHLTYSFGVFYLFCCSCYLLLDLSRIFYCDGFNVFYLDLSSWICLLAFFFEVSVYHIISIGWHRWDRSVSFNFYRYFCVRWIRSVKNLGICVIGKISIFFAVVFPKIH